MARFSSKNRFTIRRVKEVSEGQERIGYARVSTMEQAVDSHALDQQVSRLERAGATLIIVDIQTGRRDDRPGLLEAMRLVREAKACEVIVTRLDRLGRKVTIIRKNISIIQNSSANLKVLDQQIDLSNANGMFLVNMIASLAELEVEQLSERVRHGKEFSRRNLKASDCRPIAYDVDENKKYVLDRKPFLCLLEQRSQNHEGDVEEISGLSWADIAQDLIETFLQAKGTSPALKKFFVKYGIGHTNKANGNDKVLHLTPTSFRKWLLNPVLRGHTAYLKRITTPDGKRQDLPPEKWLLIENTHPEHRLISDETYSQICEILQFNASRQGSRLYSRKEGGSDGYGEYTYLSGLVFCAECGSRAYSKTRHSKDGKTIYKYFCCRNGRLGCSNIRGARKELIEHELIAKLLKQSELQSQNPPELTPAHSLEVSKSENIKRLEAKLAKLEEIEDFDPQLEKIKAQFRRQIQEETNPFAANCLASKTAEEIVQAGNNLLIWYTLSIDEKVAVYPRVVHRITIYQGEVQEVILKTSDVAHV